MRKKNVLITTLLLLIFFYIIRIFVLSELDEDNIPYVNLENKINEAKLANTLLEEQILTKSSLQFIALKASEMGFVKASILVLGRK